MKSTLILRGNRGCKMFDMQGQFVTIKRAVYATGAIAPNYPVPAIAYYYSYDKAHYDLQYVMLCSDRFADAVISYNKGASR